VTLANLQREFFAALFGTEALADPRAAIYRRNMLANLHNALAATYPVVRRLVGEAFFREAAAQYARLHPSRSADLNGYGESFAAFLEDYEFARGLPYLPDTARLEWACHECFHGPDGTALDFAALARVDPERQGEIRFSLHPAARLVSSPHPVLALWEANQPDGDGTPLRDGGPDHVLVRREGLGVRVRLIEEHELHFLERLRDGATLEEAIDAAPQPVREALGEALARFGAEAVIADFALGESEA
jgi:Putative DNA-binding domain